MEPEVMRDITLDRFIDKYGVKGFSFMISELIKRSPPDIASSNLGVAINQMSTDLMLALYRYKTQQQNKPEKENKFMEKSKIFFIIVIISFITWFGIIVASSKLINYLF